MWTLHQSDMPLDPQAQRRPQGGRLVATDHDLRQALVRWWKERPVKTTAHIFMCLEELPCLDNHYGNPSWKDRNLCAVYVWRQSEAFRLPRHKELDGIDPLPQGLFSRSYSGCAQAPEPQYNKPLSQAPWTRAGERSPGEALKKTRKVIELRRQIG